MTKYGDTFVEAERIKTVLNGGDDFAFEMQVLNCLKSIEFRKVDLVVEHSGTYIDPVSQLARQFDIRACFSRRSPDNRWFWKIRAAIECKRLKPQAPMVVSRSKRTARESYHSYIVAAANELSPMSAKVSKSSSNQTFYQRDEFVGRSLTQISYSDTKPLFDGDIYTKWAQAIASADDLVWEGLADVAGRNSIVVSATIPFLIVPNDTLWTIDYDEEGNRLEPVLAKSCEFYVGKPASPRPGLGKFTITHFHIFTLEGLRAFLANKLNETDFWGDRFQNQ